MLEDLVRGVDVVFSNLRGDQPAKLRITYDDLKDVNPLIVCCSLSGFGATGPRAKEGGYDYIMQALAGWMSLTGPPEGGPERSGLPIVDLSGGYVAAISILAGIWRARRDGVGCDCDVSLFETALAELLYIGTWTASKGYTPPRRENSAHPSIVPFQNFRTSDGWVVVAAPKPKFWKTLCDVIGKPELAGRPALLGLRRPRRAPRCAARDPRPGVCRAHVECVGRRSHGCRHPLRPVNDVAGALEDPQTIARGMVHEYEHPQLGTVRQIGSPLRLDADLPTPTPRPVPRRAHRGRPPDPVRVRRRQAARADRGRRLRATERRSRARLNDSPRRGSNRMPKRELTHPELSPAPGFSRAVAAPTGTTVYFSGQVPTDASGATVGTDIATQADACLAKISGYLTEAGTTMDAVVMMTFYTTDISGMGKVREVRERYLSAPFPAMTGVEVVALANPEWLIEIDAVAVVE